MSYDFSALTPEQAIQLIAASADPLLALEATAPRDQGTSDSSLAAQVRRFLAGDHWQDGAGWVGPMPIVNGQPDTTAQAAIRERFVSRNMIEDVTTRHTDGVVGREPAWGFTPMRAIADDEEPTQAEQDQIDTIEAELTAWWDKRKCHALFQRATAEALLSGRAVLRLYVPAARLTDIPASASSSEESATDAAPPARGVEAATITDALDHIFVEVVTADDATVYTDTDAMEQVGVVRYFRQGLQPGTVGPRVVELSYLDGTPATARADRSTVVRIATENEPAVELPLGGHLTHFAITRPPLIGAAIVSIQKALNLAISMLPRNVETSGFTERTLLNVQLNGERKVDPATGKEKFIPDPYITGPATTQVLQGTVIEDPEKGNTLATPDIRYREPSPVTPTTAAIDALSAEILREAKQAHVLGNDQIQSGISRVQARADFEKSLGRTQAALEPAGRWLIETVLRLAVYFSADKGGIVPEAFRAQFSCFTDTGPLDPQEKTTITAAGSAGFVSDEWVMQALGVEDVDAETARLNAQPGKRIELRTKKAAALKAFTDAGLSLGLAAQLAGFEDDEVNLIQEDEAANPIPAPVPATLQPAMNADGTPKLDANGAPVMEPAPASAPPNTNPADEVKAELTKRARQVAGAAA